MKWLKKIRDIIFGQNKKKKRKPVQSRRKKPLKSSKKKVSRSSSVRKKSIKKASPKMKSKAKAKPKSRVRKSSSSQNDKPKKNVKKKTGTKKIRKTAKTQSRIKTRKSPRLPTSLKQRKKALKRPEKAAKSSGGELVGEVIHFFAGPMAAVIKVSCRELSSSDTIEVRGATTSFKQKVKSMQINHIPIDSARKGEEIGLQVKSRVRTGDLVYRIG